MLFTTLQDMYSWSTSDNWSRDCTVTTGAALDGRFLLAVDALVGVAEDLLSCVATEDW